MKIYPNVLAAGFAILSVTAPATASIKIATYSGIIESGTDETGVFGTVGQDLTGLSYSSTYTYNFSLGGYQIVDDTNRAFLSRGGIDLGIGTPVIDTTITINGFTQHILGSFQGQVDFSSLNDGHGTYVGWVGHQAFELQFDGEPYTWLLEEKDYASGFIQNIGQGAPMIGRYDLNIAPTPITRANSYMEIDHYNHATDKHFIHAFAHFSQDAIYSVIDGPADPVDFVPEPGSWAMMIAGFGLTGASLRRRRAIQMA